VVDHQNQLSALQPTITQLTRQAREHWQNDGVNHSERENHLRGIISDLIELESQNNASLAAAKEVTRKQLDQLDGARQNLKRVQRSYSPLRPAMWNSFS
jgi:chromosome segregation ATPase